MSDRFSTVTGIGLIELFSTPYGPLLPVDLPDDLVVVVSGGCPKPFLKIFVEPPKAYAIFPREL